MGLPVTFRRAGWKTALTQSGRTRLGVIPVFGDIDVISSEQLISQLEYVGFLRKFEKHVERIIINEILGEIEENGAIFALKCA